MSRSVSAGWMSGMSGEVGLFSNSSKFSAHQLSWPALSTIGLSSLSFTGLSVWPYLPVKCEVMPVNKAASEFPLYSLLGM